MNRMLLGVVMLIALGCPVFSLQDNINQTNQLIDIYKRGDINSFQDLLKSDDFQTADSTSEVVQEFYDWFFREASLREIQSLLESRPWFFDSDTKTMKFVDESHSSILYYYLSLQREDSSILAYLYEFCEATVNLKSPKLGAILLDLASQSNLDSLSFFIRKGFDVNTVIGSFTLLQSACRSDDLDAVKFLVENGANVNQFVPNDLGVYENAIRCSEPGPILDYLVANGARDDTMYLQYLLSNNQYTIESGVRDWSSVNNIYLSKWNSRNLTLLHALGSTCRLVGIKALLDHGANLMAKDDRGWYPYTYTLLADQVFDEPTDRERLESMKMLDIRNMQKELGEATVTSESASIFQRPDTSSKKLFAAHSGDRLLILGNSDFLVRAMVVYSGIGVSKEESVFWINIRTKSGIEGWVLGSDLGTR